MKILVLILAISSVLKCFGQSDDEEDARKRLAAVKGRMKVERQDCGDEGSIFTVRISPPEKPSDDLKKFAGLSEFARAVDVPCKKVEIGLNSYGPSGLKDLSLTLGFRRIEPNDGIFFEFHLPKSHSGHDNGFPFLVLICSGIYKADGKLIDWIPTPLVLMEPENRQDNTSQQKVPVKPPVTQMKRDWILPPLLGLLLGVAMGFGLSRSFRSSKSSLRGSVG